MRLAPILPRIYRAEYQGLHDLAMAFVRIQEFSDGAHYHRKIFEMEAFIEDWRERKGGGEFTYPQRWNGYNVPGTVITEWLSRAQAESKVRPEEAQLLAALKGAAGAPPWGDLYLFGVCDEEGPAEKDLVTEHETAHAFFHLYDRYRRRAHAFVGELPRDFRLRAEAVLRGKGYHRSAFPDEIQAYLSTGDPDHGMLGLKTLGCRIKQVPAIEALQGHYLDWKRRMAV